MFFLLVRFVLAVCLVCPRSCGVRSRSRGVVGVCCVVLVLFCWCCYDVIYYVLLYDPYNKIKKSFQESYHYYLLKKLLFIFFLLCWSLVLLLFSYSLYYVCFFCCVAVWFCCSLVCCVCCVVLLCCWSCLLWCWLCWSSCSVALLVFGSLVLLVLLFCLVLLSSKLIY